jgi:hypothetical protein
MWWFCTRSGSLVTILHLFMYLILPFLLCIRGFSQAITSQAITSQAITSQTITSQANSPSDMVS